MNHPELRAIVWGLLAVCVTELYTFSAAVTIAYAHQVAEEMAAEDDALAARAEAVAVIPAVVEMPEGESTKITGKVAPASPKRAAKPRARPPRPPGKHGDGHSAV